MKDASILLVDDEQSILELLLTVLHKEGYSRVDTVMTGEAAIAACEARTYDLIVLDVQLPGRSGLEICPFLRQTTDAPILFLTARTSDFDKLTGFAVGGDDYITKPFNPMEVIARIGSQLRRYMKAAGPESSVHASHTGKASNVYDYGRFQVDEAAGELLVEQQPVSCPALVFQLLLFLCKNPNRIFTKSELYERVWGEESLHDDNTVMVHIHRIRERIEPDPANPIYIINMRGLGYKLVQPDTRRIPVL